MTRSSCLKLLVPLPRCILYVMFVLTAPFKCSSHRAYCVLRTKQEWIVWPKAQPPERCSTCGGMFCCYICRDRSSDALVHGPGHKLSMMHLSVRIRVSTNCEDPHIQSCCSWRHYVGSKAWLEESKSPRIPERPEDFHLCVHR